MTKEPTIKTIFFYKYQGTGNDFILIDNRDFVFPQEDRERCVRKLCDRRFGIGADGLILLQNREGYNFEMVYFNADGKLSSMCGNGGRCITALAHRLGIIDQQCTFLAVDGPHEAKLVEGENWVALKMGNVGNIEVGEDYLFMDTGSPHYVVYVEDIDDIDVVENGRAIRYSKRFRKEGVNVNFVEKKENGLEVATYERGVEDETLSCGTGVTASAISLGWMAEALGERTVNIHTKGGPLKVQFEGKENDRFENIWLIGPATPVFTGQVEVGMKNEGYH